MKQIRSILLAYLGNNGFSNRTIAKATNVSRPVVAKYLGILAKHPLTLTQVKSLNDAQLQKHLEIDAPAIYETQENVELSSWLNENIHRLSKVGVTRRLLHEEYTEKYNNPLQYSQFCFVLKNQYAEPESSALYNHKAGDKLYVDFTGEKLHWLDTSQVMHTEEIFLSVLGASAYVFATPTYSQKQEDFANAMQDAFLFFGGVPRAVVPDCLKSAVIHNDGYEPVHNPLFKKLLDHYGTFSIPARPHHPKDKPFAENSVNLIYRQILARIDGKTFVNRDAMLVWWKKALAKINATPFQKLPGSRQELFDKTDKLALKPLPEFLFDLTAIKAQTVGTTNTVYISEDKTYYSVPYALFGKKVDIHITPKQIHIWYENECRVTHERKFEAGKVILNEHLSEDQNWFAGRNISEQIRSFEVKGKHVFLWAKKIEAISGHEDIAWNLLNGLSKIIAKYPTRIDAVCRIALNKNLCSLKHLNDIINTDEDIIFIKNEQRKITLPFHENIRGSDYYNSFEASV